MHLACGLSVGLTGLAAGYAIGIVGDMGVRSYMLQSRIFVGMVLILIFGEVLGLYGLVNAIFRLAMRSLIVQAYCCPYPQHQEQRLNITFRHEQIPRKANIDPGKMCDEYCLTTRRVELHCWEFWFCIEAVITKCRPYNSIISYTNRHHRMGKDYTWQVSFWYSVRGRHFCWIAPFVFYIDKRHLYVVSSKLPDN